MNISKNLCYRLFLAKLFILFTALPLQVASEDDSCLASSPNQATYISSKKAQGLKERFNSQLAKERKKAPPNKKHKCLLAAKQIAGIKNAIFVDVREVESFNEARIPGAISMEKYKIESREFLKGKPVIIVDHNYRYLESLDLCELLPSKGFKEIYVLRGGFSAGKKYFSKSAKIGALGLFKTISPKKFDQLKYKSEWYVLDIVDDAGKASVVGKYHVYTQESGLSFIENQLPTLVEKYLVSNEGQYPNILIATQDGLDYEEYTRLLPKAAINYMYLLQGGKINYRAEADKQQKIFTARVKSEHTKKGGCR